MVVGCWYFYLTTVGFSFVCLLLPMYCTATFCKRKPEILRLDARGMRRCAPGAGKTAFWVILRKKGDAAHEAGDGADGRVRSMSGLIGLGESGLVPEWTGPDK